MVTPGYEKRPLHDALDSDFGFAVILVALIVCVAVGFGLWLL